MSSYIKAKYEVTLTIAHKRERRILIQRNDDYFGFFTPNIGQHTLDLDSSNFNAKDCSYWNSESQFWIKQVIAGRLTPFYTAGPMDLSCTKNPVEEITIVCNCPKENYSWNGIGCQCGAFQIEQEKKKHPLHKINVDYSMNVNFDRLSLQKTTNSKS